MKALVCDICGGKLVMSAGGIATCDSCGMQYSQDRVREMVQEIRGTVTVAGPVHTDSAHLLDNYLTMASNAIDAKNYSEGESYCNKIIEIDPQNYMAWLHKGSAALWQSKVASLRMEEAVTCFARAYEYAPEEEKTSILELSKRYLKEFSLALIKRLCDNFEKWPDGEESAGFYSGLTSIVTAITSLVEKTKAKITIDDLLDAILIMLTKACSAAFANSKSEYDGYFKFNKAPDQYDLDKYLKKINIICQLLENGIKLCSTKTGEDAVIQARENLGVYYSAAISAKGYKWEYCQNIDYYNVYNSAKNGGGIPDTDNKGVYWPHYSLSDSGKAQYNAKIEANRKIILDYKAKKAAEEKRRVEKEIADAYNSFWTTYKNEKSLIEAEIDSLGKLKSAQKLGKTQMKMVQDRIQALNDILVMDRRTYNGFDRFERQLLSQRDSFVNSVLKQAGYDAYLDANPILKQAEELSIQQKNLIEEYSNVSKTIPTPGGIYIALFLIAIFGLLAYVGALVEVEFLTGLCGICAAISVLVFFGVLKGYLNGIKGRTKLTEIAVQLKAIHKKIDQMEAIPQYIDEYGKPVKNNIPKKDKPVGLTDDKIKSGRASDVLGVSKFFLIILAIAVALAVIMILGSLVLYGKIYIFNGYEATTTVWYIILAAAGIGSLGFPIGLIGLIMKAFESKK